MAAEDSDWFPVYVILDGGGASIEERREVLESAEMRRFFKGAYAEYQVGKAVELLGGPGDLSLQMEWLHAEGSDVTPANALKRPEIAPRDEALMDALDRATPLFHLFEAAENAREALNAYFIAQLARPSFAFSPSWALLLPDPHAKELDENRKATEAALDAELKKMGYADLAAFKDEFRRFEAFFHGFALQTAFLMLRENRELALKEGERMRGPAMDELYEALGPARELHTARLDYAGAEKDIPAAGVTPEGERAATLRERVTDLEKRVDKLMGQLVPRFPIIARKEEREWAVDHAYDREGLAQHFQDFSQATVANIGEVQEKLSADSSKIWKMPPAIARAKEALGIAEGTAMDGIIRRKIAQVERDEVWEKLVIGALAIGLGLVSMGTGTIAILAGAGAFTLSLYQVGESWEEYSLKTATYGSALDLADALATEDPSVVWLLIDIAGALLDLKGVLTAGKAAGKTVIKEAADVLGEAASKLRYAPDARAAAEAALELEAQAAKYGPEVQALVRNAANREIAKRAALAEAPDLVKRLKAIAPDLANDEDTLAGLVHMGEATAQAMTKALTNEPALLQRLGRLCAQDPAIAMGAARLRTIAGDEGALTLLRDALMRRDASFARRFLGAAGDGHLSDDALRAAAREGPAAAERELAAATGMPAPGTTEARAALDATAKLEGEPKNILDLKTEWETVQSSRGVVVQEGEYVAEVTLPNGHKWKRTKGGGWCRFTDPFCLTVEGMKALEEAPVDPFTRALRRAEQETADVEKLLADPKALEERFRRVIKDKLDPEEEFTAAEEDVLKKLLKQENARRTEARQPLGPKTLEDVKSPADIRSAFQKNPKLPREKQTPADIVRREAREAETKALAELAASNRPLLDMLHDALRLSTKDKVLKRATKNGVAIDEFLQAPPPSGALDVEHVIPLQTIVNMPGFTSLPVSDQVVISNAIGNLKAVDHSVNRSRQALSWTNELAGRSLYTPAALKAAQDFEPSALKTITDLLNKALKSPGSLTMEDII